MHKPNTNCGDGLRLSHGEPELFRLPDECVHSIPPNTKLVELVFNPTAGRSDGGWVDQCDGLYRCLNDSFATFGIEGANQHAEDGLEHVLKLSTVIANTHTIIG